MTCKGKSRFYVDLQSGRVDWIYPYTVGGRECYADCCFYEPAFRRIKELYPPGADFYRALGDSSAVFRAAEGGEYYTDLKELYSSRAFCCGEGKQTYENLDLIFKAKKLITEYSSSRGMPAPSFSDKSKVFLGRSEDPSGHTVEVYADLTGYRITTFVDGKRFLTSSFSSLRDMTTMALENLDLAGITDIPEYALDRFLSAE